MAAHRLVPSPSWSLSMSTTSSWICCSPAASWESVNFTVAKSRWSVTPDVRSKHQGQERIGETEEAARSGQTGTFLGKIQRT